MSVALAGLTALPGGTIDVLQTGRNQIANAKRQTSVAVLLPAKLPVAGPVPRLYVTGSGSRDRWSLDFAGVPGCGGANACFVASFEGRRGARLRGRPNARLAGGDPALYDAVSCGASCAPATLWFRHRGTLCTWQVKDPPHDARAILIRLAANAIAAGPR